MAKKKTKSPLPFIPVEDLTNYFDLYMDRCAGYTTTKTMINQSGDKIQKRDVSGILDPIPPTIDGFFTFIRRELSVSISRRTFYNWCDAHEEYMDFKELMIGDISGVIQSQGLTGKLNPAIAMFMLYNLGLKNPKYEQRLSNSNEQLEEQQDNRAIIQVIVPDKKEVLKINIAEEVQYAE